MAVIDQFISLSGTLTISRSLVAGYDFMQDAPQKGDRSSHRLVCRQGTEPDYSLKTDLDRCR